jgi:hypothetical protein
MGFTSCNDGIGNDGMHESARPPFDTMEALIKKTLINRAKAILLSGQDQNTLTAVDLLALVAQVSSCTRIF